MSANSYRKILVCRTDRIGDVLLSTPVLKALRKNFPRSRISVLVRPYARDVVLGNPYLDELIIYDKYGRQKSLLGSIRFAWSLRKKKFDLALVLHPTNRMHWITYLAGIKKRIGFNRKMGFLLTDKLEHKKQQGEKHELEYTLDILSLLGIKDEGKQLFMPIRQDSEKDIEKFLSKHSVKKGEKLIAIHPGASCPSKVWPDERFAQVADSLAQELKARIIIVAGPDDIQQSQEVLKRLHCAGIDASGKTTVSQLASLIRRCSLFISNDSGPVHIAAALGVPVVAIFGRSQAGLSPRRWGPVGKNVIVLHKQVGCQVCLAHNCSKHFACLLAISVQEVLSAARGVVVG
ncbi:MAG: lipopolysaccharide heptosyltransferase II [Candidatus Omnitrophica bacterium]|nr:lipopolysaccharide heptosyltransferase II [Candidatus Omnitrophota bacterium]